MISAKQNKLAHIINELEVVLDTVQGTEHITRLQQAINILKENSITLEFDGTPITFFADNARKIVLETSSSFEDSNPMESENKANELVENGVRFVDTTVVANYYGVTTETVRNWIKDKKISGKQLSGHRGKWFIPAEEFEYLKEKEEADDLTDEIQKLLGEEYPDDWDVEIIED